MLRGEADLDARVRNNLRFYIAMKVVVLAVGKSVPTAAEIAVLDLGVICDDDIRVSLAVVKAAYDALGGEDRVAKGSLLVEKVKTQLIAAVD